MDKVPVMISTKDLSYISDMINWNFMICKVCNSYIENVNDLEIQNTLKNIYTMHLNHYQKLVNILGGNNE